MELGSLAGGLISYLCFLIALSFHEYAHGWMAYKCGDDTAKVMGRLTLNPAVHIDMLGTVIIPLVMLFLPLLTSGVSGFIVGWAKPVPVNPFNFRNRQRDDNLVSVAGPLSNLILAFVILCVIKLLSIFYGVGEGGNFSVGFQDFLLNLVYINIVLAWFNMIPVPPLDGSHLMKNLVGMSYETYLRFSQYGIIILIILLNFTPLQQLLNKIIIYTYWVMCLILGL